MLIHVNDAVTLQGARALRQPLIIPYGIHQEYELQLVTGHDNRPVDIESRGCVKWTLTVTPSPENPTKVLAYAVFPENIATGNCIRFDLAATSVEMYKHVAGNPATPAILQLQGFTGEDAPATTVVVLPVTLTTTAQQRRPVDLSTALMQELQLAVSTAGAAQRAIYSQQISTGEDADRAEHAAAMAQASEANAQQSSEEAAAASADARTAADDAEDYAKAAKSWAVGDTGTRQDEDTDNSMYYSRQAAESENGARLAAQAAELARDAAVDAKLLAESAQAAAEAAASGAADATADAIEAQFRDDITATGAAVTAAQTAASNALSAQQAAAASAVSAQQSAYDAYDYAQRAMTNLPLILQAPPTTETPSILGKLGLWHDEAHDVNHLYHLAYITTSGNLTAYHWEECLLLSSLNQAGSLVTTDANGKIPSGVLPVSGDGVLGAVSVLSDGSHGVSVSPSGDLGVESATEEDIAGRQQPYKPITPATLDYAVAQALAGDNHMALTEAQQEVARSVLGIDSMGLDPLTGSGAPTASTEAEYGQLYKDTGTGRIYLCVDSATQGGATTTTWLELVLSSQKGVANGVATLGNDGKVPAAQLPTIPTQLSQLSGDATHRTVTDAEKATWNAKSDFSGDYNDLTNKPAIPTQLSQLTADAAHRTVTDTEKAEWNAKSTFSGNYNDLTNKPTIPTQLSQLTADATHRTVTDTEKSAWNAKGAALGLSIDPQTYVMTLTLKSSAGDTLDTRTVDLPLESMVVSASCTGGVLTLTLQSGATVDVDVSSLVDGLIPASEKGAVNGVATLGADGKVPSGQLPTIPTALSQLTQDSMHRTVTDAEKQAWSNQSGFSGDYNDLTNKPDIPDSAEDVGAIPVSEKGAANGVAELDANGKVPSTQIPLASADSIGGIKVISGYGLTWTSTRECLQIRPANNSDISSRSGSYYPISPFLLNDAVTAALTDANHITLDATQQATAQTVFNVPGLDSNGKVPASQLPDFPTKTSDLTNDSGFQTASDVATAISGKADSSALTAHTGNTTIHVTAADKTAWNAKSDFSGNYNDLTNKPTIPTKTSDLTNDSGFQTASDVATAVSGKADNSALTAHTGNTTIHVTAADKTAWNAKSDFSGSYNDLTNKPTIPSSAADIGAIPASEKGQPNGVAMLDANGNINAAQIPGMPTKVSELQNDSGYQTAQQVQSTVDTAVATKADASDLAAHTGNTTIHVTSADKTAWNAKSDFSGNYNDLTNKPTIPSKTSDLTNDSGFQTASDVATAVSGKADSSALTAHTGNTTIHVTAADKTAWNAKSDFSGSYNDLTNKPDIPDSAEDIDAIPVAEKGAANGVASLGATSKVPVEQLPVGDTTSKGVVGAKLTSGLLLNSGELSINAAGRTAIDARTSINPIIPQTLEYAVRSVLPNVTFIGGLETNYSLLDSSSATNEHSHIYRHTPDSTTVYRLPEVTNTGLQHVIELTVNFAYTTSYSILDHNGNAVPLAYPLTVALNDIITFKMEYSAFLSRWVICPERQGSVAFVPSTSVGVANGVASLGSDGKVPASQLPTASGVPTALHRNSAPGLDTVGVPGQLCFNDEDGSVYACRIIYDLGMGDDSLQYLWSPVVAEAGGYVTNYLLVGVPNNYTKTAQTQRVVAIGSGLNQTGTTNSLAVGSTVAQTNASASIAAGVAVTQTGGAMNIAVGNVLTQTQAQYCAMFGANNSQSQGSLYSLVSGSYNSMTAGGEDILMAGVGLQSSSYKAGAAYFGRFNAEKANTIRITGLGTGSNARKNIEELSEAGDHYITGGHQQGVTVISSSTTAYTLAEGAYRQQIGADYCAYTLPAVTDTTRTHEISIDVCFSTATDSCTFLDNGGNEITPLSTPTIEAGTVVSYLCWYEAFTESWVVMPVVVGKKEITP